MSASCYHTLLALGYTHEQVIPHVSDIELVPYTPNKHFQSRFLRARYIIDLINTCGLTKQCFIGGGFLVRCALNKGGGDAVAAAISGDIDLFCFDGTQNKLVKAFIESFDCICFTAGCVTTILVRNCRTPIQVIGCGSSDLAQELNDFDLTCCKLAYYNGAIVATASFLKMLLNKKAFDVTGSIKATRVEKYRKLGFIIDTSKAQVVGYYDATMERNKYYKWTDESPDRLLYLVRLIFGESYKPTEFPIPSQMGREWRQAYDNDCGKDDSTLQVKQRGGVSIVSSKIRKEYALTNVTVCIEKRYGNYECPEERNFLAIKLQNSEELTPLFQQAESELFPAKQLTKVLGRYLSTGNIRYITVSDHITSTYKWKRAVNHEGVFNCDLILTPTCIIIDGKCRVRFTCVSLHII